MKRTFLLVASTVLAAQARAQVFTGPSGNPNFGEEITILADADGGGRREIAVSSPAPFGSTTVSSGFISILSGENSTQLVTLQPFQAGVPAVGAEFGRQLANVGDIDGIPGDEFAVATPNINNAPGLRGEVSLFSLRQISGTWQVVFVRSLFSSVGQLNNATFGTSLAVLTGQNTANGRALAVGIPNLNRVDIFDPNTGTPMRTLDVNTVTGSIGGGLGFSLAAGPDNVLAAGAPDYRPPNAGSNQFRYGYVAIYDLSSSGHLPRSFLYRGLQSESLGRAICSVGQLPGNPSSTMSDFATLGGGSLGVQPTVFLFHSPAAVMTGPTPTVAVATLPVGNPGPWAATDGRMAALNDANGDGIGDIAVSAGGLLNFLSTAGNTLSALASPVGASTNAGLASGPDLRGMGGTDVLLGTPNLTPSTGVVSVQMIATSVRLPNPAGLNLAVGGARPVLGASYPLTATGTPGALVGVLVNLAPFTPIPFNGGPALQYLSTTGAVTVGIGPSPASFNVTMPGAFQNAGQAFLFQAVQFNANGTLTPSNGVLARLGFF